MFPNKQRGSGLPEPVPAVIDRPIAKGAAQDLIGVECEPEEPAQGGASADEEEQNLCEIRVVVADRRDLFAGMAQAEIEPAFGARVHAAEAGDAVARFRLAVEVDHRRTRASRSEER